MSEERCPHIGLPNYPEYAIVFPEEINRCHKTDPPEPIGLDHQKSHCLSSNYENCSVYKRSSAGPLPQMLRKGAMDPNTRKIVFRWGAVLAVVILVGAVLFGWWRSTGREQIVAFGQRLRTARVTDTPEFQEQSTPTDTPTAIPPTETPTPESETCPIPDGWVPYVLVEGDTFESIAASLESSVVELLSGNCLESTELSPGEIIFAPAMPEGTSVETATPTAVACPIPEDWVLYTVQKGDSLRLLSRLSGTSEEALIEANCLESTKLNVGQEIYLPVDILTPTPTETVEATPEPTRRRVPTRTPTPTEEPTSTRRPTRTSAPPTATSRPPTATPVPPTNTPRPPTDEPPPTNPPEPTKPPPPTAGSP